MRKLNINETIKQLLIPRLFTIYATLHQSTKHKYSQLTIAMNKRDRTILINNIFAYVTLLIGFGSYLSIALTETNFEPSRIGLALTVCSGLIAAAVSQIAPFSTKGSEEFDK